MAAKGMYETVKQAIQDVVAPDLERIKGEMVGLKGEMAGVRAEVKAMDKRVEDGFRGVQTEIGSLRREVQADLRTVHTRIDALDKRLQDALDIRERLATLEAKVAARG